MQKQLYKKSLKIAKGAVKRAKDKWSN